MARERSATPAWSPNIPHALHMPGHIYAQSDKIQEAISAFSAAAAIEQKWIASDSLYPTGHSRPQRALPDSGAESRRPLRRLDEVGAAPASPSRRTRASAPATTSARSWRQGYFGLIKTRGPLREVERDSRRQDDPGLRQAGAERVAALGDGAGVRGNTGQLDKAKATLADMQKDLDGGDVGEGTDRHRRAGARGDDRGARRRQEEGVRAVPQGRRPRSGHALHRAAVLSASGRRRLGQRRAGDRRPCDRREGVPRSA